MPLFAVIHVLHIAAFRPSAADRASLSPVTLHWREGVMLVHAVTLLLLLPILSALFAVGKQREYRFLGPAVGLLYLLHAAVVVAVDQAVITSVTPFIGYCLGVAVVLALTPRQTFVLYGAGIVTFVVSMLAAQPSRNARLASMPNGLTIVVLGVVLSILLHGARRRDLLQRLTIEEQQAELARLNAGLERRVSDQVAEIVQRAEEVDRLNAQLRAQVRARSEELSNALTKLAEQRGAAPRLAPGVTLADRFLVEGLIGEGGMGEVYAGIDRTTGASVAIKVIQAGSSVNVDALQRFLREVRSAATIDHPAVVRMLHVDVTDEGLLFQVQELVQGVTLHSRVRRGHPWNPAIAARVVSILAEALAAAHERGIVHRDVKPANVMLTAGPPGLKLLDFGIAKLAEDARGEAGQTRTGAIVGTPYYMAPEQMLGSRDVTASADLYAVGVVLFLLLTGQFPFDGPAEALGRLASASPPDVRAIEPRVPAAIADLTGRCLAYTPSERPTAREVATSLATFADAEGLPSLWEIERTGGLGRAEATPLVPQGSTLRAAGVPTAR